MKQEDFFSMCIFGLSPNSKRKCLIEIILEGLSKLRDSLCILLQESGVLAHQNPFYDIIQFITKDDEKELEFKIADYRFLLIAECNITARTLYIRTYQVVRDLKNHSNYTTEQIDILDVGFVIDGRARFFNPSDKCEMFDFSTKYYSRIKDFITKKEARNVELSPIY